MIPETPDMDMVTFLKAYCAETGTRLLLGKAAREAAAALLAQAGMDEDAESLVEDAS